MKPDSSHRPTVVDDPAVRAAENGAGATTRPAARFCAFCGTSLDERTPAITRFGEPFCSDAHGEEFAQGVRAARVRAAASAAATDVAHGEASIDTQPAGPTVRTWTEWLKRWGCWLAPLGLLLALPLLSSGGIAAAAGSLLSVLALLACPLAMLLMMRSMGKMNQGQGANVRHGKKDGREKDE